MATEHTVISERFRELIGTAEKLKDYKDVDVALEDTKRWLASTQTDLKDARAELAKLKTEADALKATNAQEVNAHKAELQAQAAKVQEAQRQKLAHMEANTRAAIGALDAQFTAKRDELERTKKELQTALDELEDIHLAFTDAFEVINQARKGRQ